MILCVMHVLTRTYAHAYMCLCIHVRWIKSMLKQLLHKTSMESIGFLLQDRVSE